MGVEHALSSSANSPAHVWIERPAELAELAPRLEAATEIALDTESNSMFAYRERLCLVQLNLCDDGPLVAIDPLAFASAADALAPLVAWLGGQAATSRRVLMHGGEYDVAVLKRELGVAPTRLYDTQAAAAMLGIERTGYANLCGALLDVAVDKEHQQFDWGRRPVPPGPRRYALDDVRHLPALARTLERFVAEADLEEEVAIACEAVAAAAPHEAMDDAERFWRVVGAERLAPEVMARLASLVAWREAEAATRDQPPGRLVPKEALLKLARRPAESAAALDGLGLSKRLVAERADAILDALAHPIAPPPKPRRPRPDPAIDARTSRLKAWRLEESKRRGVVPQAVLPTRALDALAAAPTDGALDLGAIPQLGHKRVRLYGDTLRALLRR